MRTAILVALLLIVAGCGGATGNAVNPWPANAVGEPQTLPAQEPAAEVPAEDVPAEPAEDILVEVPGEVIAEEPVVEEVPPVPDIDPSLIVTALPGTSFSVWYPKENMTLKGPILSLSLKAVNFSIGKMSKLNQSKDNRPREGHFHVIFDYMEEGEYIEMEDFSKTIRGMEAGDRTMRILMVNNDHTPLGIEKVIHFKVPQIGIDGTDEQTLYTS